MDQAERLRMLVADKKEINNNSRSRVITVTSGKGGVGKTSMSVNLALSFQKKGKRAVIVDADFGLANVEVMLGVHPKYNISDLLTKNMEMEDIVTEGPCGIGFISGGSGVAELVSLQKEDVQLFASKLEKLDNMADVIIIDTGAGISPAVQEFVLSSQEVLLVITPEPTSTMDAYALLKTLNRRSEFAMQEKGIKVVANRVAKYGDGNILYENLNMVASKFLNIELEYLGEVMQDVSLQKSIIQQNPVVLSYPNNNSAKCINKIADELLDTYKESDKRKNGFVSFFMNMLKTNKNR